MVAYHSVILEAYRAALADWAAREIEGRDEKSALISQTATLASIWTNDIVTEDNVVDVIKSRH